MLLNSTCIINIRQIIQYMLKIFFAKFNTSIDVYQHIFTKYIIIINQPKILVVYKSKI